MTSFINRTNFLPIVLRALLCFCVQHAKGARFLNARDFGAVGDGFADETKALTAAFANAQNGDAVILSAGKYMVKPGTSFVIGKKITIAADGAQVVNARFLLLADVVMRGMTLIENDCYYDPANPAACPVSTPLITIGYKGYPVHRARLDGLTLSFTRAYTGIAMGYDTLENVTISDIDIQANALSAISIYGGHHIVISEGVIRGGDMAVVDDGIAISALYGPIDDVNISNMTAKNNFDLVGIGAEMLFPTTSVSVSSSECVETAACIYVKLGNDTRLPGVVGNFSMLDGLEVDDINVSDPQGKRYLASVWIAAADDAKGQNIHIAHVTTLALGAVPEAVAAKLNLTSSSAISNLTLRKFTVQVPDRQSASAAKPVPAGGVFIQVWGSAKLSDVSLLDSSFSGMGNYAIDSTKGTVENLLLSGVTFMNVGGLTGVSPVQKRLIPYAFALDYRIIGD